MQTWVGRSSYFTQGVLAIGVVVAGLVIMIGCRRFQGDGDLLAGFPLGVLLLVIGAAGLLVAGAQTVTVGQPGPASHRRRRSDAVRRQDP